MEGSRDTEDEVKRRNDELERTRRPDGHGEGQAEEMGVQSKEEEPCIRTYE